MRGPQDRHPVNDSLEEFTKLRKGFMLTVLVYYSKRIPIKISKAKKHIGKGHREESRKDQAWAFSCPLPGEPSRMLHLPAMTSGRAHGALLTRKGFQVVGVQGFY